MIRGIYIIGLPGSHRKSISEYLKKWLDWKIIDLQEEVERKLHKTIIEVIEENKLREFEEEQEKLMLSNIFAGEIFISSDVIPKPETIEKLKNNGIIPIYLSYSKQSLERELEKSQEMHTILRIHPYEDYEREIELVSDLLIKVPTEGFSDKEIALMIVRSLEGEYDLIFSNSDKVYSGINSFHYIDEILDYEGFSNALFITYKRHFLINFRWVFDVIKKSNFEPYVFYIPEKEEIKELEYVKKIWHEIIDLKLRKNTAIVGMGGGSCLDLVGFSASTFRRGFPFVSIPTTFISQIDASIGGRNSLHYLGNKNILGTTYYPRFILIDPVFILSCDDTKFLYSLSDAVRYGLLFDESILTFLESEVDKIKSKYLPTIDNLVRKCALHKLNVSYLDPYGWSQRRPLEFANTIAYLIQETLHLDYQKALAKSIYLILKFLLRENILKDKKIFERVIGIFENYGLEYKIEDSDMEKLHKKCNLDEFEIFGIETYKSPIPIRINKDEFFKSLAE